MILNQQTLEILRIIINEESGYRTGEDLVAFFNQLGFKDEYVKGFPSRRIYTDDRLAEINGTPEIDRCVKNVFDPRNFIGRTAELDALVKKLNLYMAFEGWRVVRDDAIISIQRHDGKKIVEEAQAPPTDEAEFLNYEFAEVKISELGLDPALTDVLDLRINEIKACMLIGAPLSVVFMCGSILEGILLGVASASPAEFNTAKAAPKDLQTGRVRQFPSWTLNDFIEVAFELDYLKSDTKKYSHVLRGFRNYIHPYQQLSEKFAPDNHTAKISWQVLKAAINQVRIKKGP